ncbi:MAG: 50S ribosomal protein L9 [Phycisphaerales bacterium]|nr:MAG: 50S ribosomal protein L9 [Phycisphaerales bacterium]
MRLLLKKDIPSLGVVGDIVDVSAGYARNYLIPHHLGVEPTKANMKEIEEAKRIAAEERLRRRQRLEDEAKRLESVEVTISAAANPQGHLYGSVGPREIAAALRDEGHAVDAAQVQLHEPIKQLDNKMVPVRFSEDLEVEVKVWVVREKGAGDLEDEVEAESHHAEASAEPDEERAETREEPE